MKHLRRPIRIGVMPGGLDGLLLASATVRRSYSVFFLLPAGKQEARWARQFLPSQQCIIYNLSRDTLSMADLDFEGIVRHSDVLSVLRRHRITHLLVHHGVTPYLQAWAKKSRITLIAPAYQLARHLEHKIWFDAFLTRYDFPKPISQVVRPQDPITIRGPLVLQEPQSRGGEGTYFLKSKRDVALLVRTKKIRLTKRYLVRQFIEGTSYGITVFVGNNGLVLSGVRLQCYSDAALHGKKIFQGIQWVPSSQLPQKVQKNITTVFCRLGQVLRQEGFRGFANVDFIVDSKGKVMIIECNPRLAASSTQLLAFPETIGGVRVESDYLKALLSPPQISQALARCKAFPRSSFQGGTLYISAPTLKRNFLITKQYQSGVYQLRQRSVRFVTADVTKVHRYQRAFIFYADAQAGERVSGDTIIASLISNFPLYDSRGILTAESLLLLNYFSYV